MWRVPPNCAGATTTATSPSIGSVRTTCSTRGWPSRRAIFTPRWIPGRTDGRRESCERARAERPRRGEHQRPSGTLGGKEGERDLRCCALFALKAGPEAGIDQRLDGFRIGQRRVRLRAMRTSRSMSGEVILEPGSKGPRSRVERFVHLA